MYRYRLPTAMDRHNRYRLIFAGGRPIFFHDRCAHRLYRWPRFDSTERGITLKDSDSDGLNENIEDVNRNGKREINETDAAAADTDGDALLDGIEDANHNGKVDKDTAGNLLETDPRTPDTDADGLYDGEEIKQSADLDSTKYTIPYMYSRSITLTAQSFGLHVVTVNAYGKALVSLPMMKVSVDGYVVYEGVVAGSVATYNGIVTLSAGMHTITVTALWGVIDVTSVEINKITTNPIDFDTDNDGLSDGQEVKGWKVTIIYERNGETKEEKMVYSDPTTNDKWDKDGLSDYDEFSNMSDPTRKDTDGDSILDKDEDQGKQWQVEGIPPAILDTDGDGKPDIDAKVVFVWGHAWICIPYPAGWDVVYKFRVKDNIKVDKVIVTVAGSSNVHYFDAPEVVVEGSVHMGWDFTGILVTGYDVDALVYDKAGNGAQGHVHIDSVLETIAKYVLAFLIALVSVLLEVLAMIFSWIWGVIEWIIHRVTSPIVEAIKNWGLELSTVLGKSWDEFVSTRSNTKSTLDAVRNVLFGSFFYVIATIATIILVIGTIVSPFVAIISTLLAGVVSFVTMIIMSVLAGGEKAPEGTNVGASKDTSLTGVIKHAIAFVDLPEETLTQWDWLGLLLPQITACVAAALADPTGGLGAIVGSSLGFMSAMLYIVKKAYESYYPQDQAAINRYVGALGVIGAIGAAIGWINFVRGLRPNGTLVK